MKRISEHATEDPYSLCVKESAREAALLILAHGSETNPKASESAMTHARTIRARRVFGEVAVGFHKGTPGLVEALEGTRARIVYLVPFFLSDGYYTRIHIPSVLGLAGPLTERRGRSLHYCPPVGLSASLNEVIARRIDGTCAHAGLDRAEASIVVAAHGTPKSAASGGVTRNCARHLAGLGRYRRVTAAFLEEAPFLAEVLGAERKGGCVVAGMFAAEGMHGEEDMRALIAEARARHPDSPLVYTGAIGTDPAFSDLIVGQVAAGLGVAVEDSGA